MVSASTDSTLSVRISLTSPLKGIVCAPRSKLVIEVDGSQHLDQQEYDAERSVYLETHGYKVLRFGNGDVMNNIEGVLGVILEDLHPAGTKLPDGSID
jgi:very-short-patch-repair endonuclease